MQLTLTDVRADRLSVFAPMPNKKDPTKPAKYLGRLILEPTHPDVAKIRAAMATVAQEKFGPNYQAVIGALGADFVCLRDGNRNLDDAGNIRPGYAGNLFVAASNKDKPTVVDRTVDPATGKAKVLQANEGRPYHGCKVNALIDIYAMTEPKGVFCTLRGLQFFADGERLGGTAPASVDEFSTFDPAPAAAMDPLAF